MGRGKPDRVGSTDNCPHRFGAQSPEDWKGLTLDVLRAAHSGALKSPPSPSSETVHFTVPVAVSPSRVGRWLRGGTERDSFYI